MRFICKVYSGQKFLTEIKATSIQTLKRQASTICNNYFNTLDEMKIVVAEGDCVTNSLTLMRVNRKSPDNTIIRGEWK